MKIKFNLPKSQSDFINLTPQESDYKTIFFEKLTKIDTFKKVDKKKYSIPFLLLPDAKMFGNYSTVSGMYDGMELRRSVIKYFFNDNLIYDKDLLLEKKKIDKNSLKITTKTEFLPYKFLCENYEKINVIFYSEISPSHSNSFICFFEIPSLENFIFELNYSDNSSSTITFSDGLEAKSKQFGFSQLFCYSPNIVNYLRNSVKIGLTLKYYNENFYTTKEIKNSISIITAMSGGNFKKSNYELPFIGEECLEYYSPEIQKDSRTIIDLINNKNKGIIFLHGDKGSGKTFFIKYLISNSKKNYFYINGEAISSFSSSAFLEFVALNSKNSVFVFEDMEHLVTSREQKNSSVISDILNASDGILADILSPIFIFTFNTNINNIDTAFLRPGRLIFEKEFKKLSFEEAKKVAKSIGVKITEDKEYSLAEIFEKQNNPKNTSIRSKKFNSEKSNTVKGFKN